MEVSDDKVGIMDVNIDRDGGHEDSAQPPHNKQRDKRNAVKHDRIVLQPPPPHRADPVKDLNGRGQGNHHRGDHKRHAESRVHANW